MKKSIVKTKHKKVKRYIIRTYSAGVFAAEIISRKGGEAELKNARRLWSWQGAASLSEMAVRGTSKPSQCKFPIIVPTQTVIGVIEVIPMTDEAWATIEAVPVWTV